MADKVVRRESRAGEISEGNGEYKEDGCMPAHVYARAPLGCGFYRPPSASFPCVLYILDGNFSRRASILSSTMFGWKPAHVIIIPSNTPYVHVLTIAVYTGSAIPALLLLQQRYRNSLYAIDEAMMRSFVSLFPIFPEIFSRGPLVYMMHVMHLCMYRNSRHIVEFSLIIHSLGSNHWLDDWFRK